MANEHPLMMMELSKAVDTRHDTCWLIGEISPCLIRLIGHVGCTSNCGVDTTAMIDGSFGGPQFMDRNVETLQFLATAHKAKMYDLFFLILAS